MLLILLRSHSPKSHLFDLLNKKILFMNLVFGNRICKSTFYGRATIFERQEPISRMKNPEASFFFFWLKWKLVFQSSYERTFFISCWNTSHTILPNTIFRKYLFYFLNLSQATQNATMANHFFNILFIGILCPICWSQIDIKINTIMINNKKKL